MVKTIIREIDTDVKKQLLSWDQHLLKGSELYRYLVNLSLALLQRSQHLTTNNYNNIITID